MLISVEHFFSSALALASTSLCLNFWEELARLRPQGGPCAVLLCKPCRMRRTLTVKLAVPTAFPLYIVMCYGEQSLKETMSGWTFRWYWCVPGNQGWSNHCILSTHSVLKLILDPQCPWEKNSLWPQEFYKKYVRLKWESGSHPQPTPLTYSPLILNVTWKYQKTFKSPGAHITCDLHRFLV